MKLSAFILAAGRGDRLRPITDHIPKPLIPILGTPVLQTVLEKVSSITDKIGLNLHYKKDLIENWINQSAFGNMIKLFQEDPVLGTGGALKNASDFLRDAPFIVHNSDIISDIDVEKLVTHHSLSGNLVTLAVHDYTEFNKLEIDREGILEGVGKTSSEKRLLAFTGVSIYSPEFLELLPSGISSVVDAWLKAVAMGYKIGTLDVSGCYWTDIGTPLSYARYVVNKLRQEGETVFIHSSATGCEFGEIGGNVVVEKEGALHEKAFLRNCIILPETKVGEKTCGRGTGSLSYENCILGPDFEIDLNESDLLGITGDEGILIGTGGSDRKYYRVKNDGGSAVLMKCPEDDPDFRRHIEFTRFFGKYLIPVPQSIDADFDNKSALFEDVGDLSLYSWLKCPRSSDRIEEMYKKILDILVLIHSAATEHVDECSLLKDRTFDYEHFRWETAYFIKRFVAGTKKLLLENPSTLNEEFHKLAAKVDNFPKTVIHRDYQSQNIMITRHEVPRLIDYQGARIGPPAYDVASILWDPYYRLRDDLRKRLLAHYFTKMKAAMPSFSEATFTTAILPCRLQRHMQALGAYGFLSLTKGKTYFMKYAPEALRLLTEDMALAGQEYPELDSLVRKLWSV